MAVLPLATFVWAAVALAAGALIARGSTAVRAGWLLGVMAACVAGTGAAELAGLDVVSKLAIVTGYAVAPLVLTLYPRARLSHPLTAAVCVAIVAGGVSLASGVGHGAGAYVVFTAAGLHLWWQFERSPDDRRALAWCWVATGTALFLTMVIGFLPGSDSDAVGQAISESTTGVVGLGLALSVPVAMAIGVVRPDWIDVRGLISEVVVAITVATVFVSIIFGVVSGFDWEGNDEARLTTAILLSMVLSFGVQRLSRVLRGTVDLLLFGERPDPLAAARSVAARIGDDPALALEAVTEALVLPYASLVVDGTELASAGDVVPHTHTLPVELDDGGRGELTVGLRPGDLRLPADDDAVLRIVAPLLALTLRTQALAEQVQDSRLRIVRSADEARRTIERNLHDGAQQHLVALAVSIGMVRTIAAEGDPAMVGPMLDQLRADVQTTIQEVRELAHGIYPPLLRDGGLGAALRAAANRSPLDCAVVDDLAARYSQEVEAAAYFCSLEAMQNAAKYAGAEATLTVRITADNGSLLVAVADTGAGFEPAAVKESHGFVNMRDRLGALGGTLDVVSTPGVGTTVTALLPATPLEPVA